MISLIAAIGKNGEIGKNNKLIWHLKEDMQYFRKTTMNHPVIMGYNTYKSIGRALPNRLNIVVTKNNKDKITDKSILVYDDLNKLIKDLKNEEEYFVIGGSSIYQEFYDIANKMYLTEINAEDRNADSYFPKINYNEWQKHIINHLEENDIIYAFAIYERLNK